MEMLRRFANVVRSKESEFAELIARETGKPLWETRTEVAAVVNKVDISVEAYAERTPQRKMEAALGNRIAVRHKPHGVLAVLGPYNFPAHLPNGHIVPALIAGNAVVFKPSEKTPATGEFLVDCFHEAKIPHGVVRLLIGGPDQGRALAGHPGIDGLLFTGSARAGMSLHRQFAETPQKILALELGGNNPLVVWSAKDIDSAAAIVVQSAFLSAGQRCTAARRLIIEDGKEEPLLDFSAQATAAGRQSLTSLAPARIPDGIAVDGWTADGQWLVVRTFGRAVYGVPMVGQRVPRMLADTPYVEDQTQVSPDGKWIAFNSDESGRWEVYVATFPGMTDKRQISIDGGMQPRWKRDSKELYYLSLDGTMMAATMAASRQPEPGMPRPLFQTRLSPSPNVPQYDVVADASRFLILEPAHSGGEPVTFVLNWAVGVKQ